MQLMAGMLCQCVCCCCTSNLPQLSSPAGHECDCNIPQHSMARHTGRQYRPQPTLSCWRHARHSECCGRGRIQHAHRLTAAACLGSLTVPELDVCAPPVAGTAHRSAQHQTQPISHRSVFRCRQVACGGSGCQRHQHSCPACSPHRFTQFAIQEQQPRRHPVTLPSPVGAHQSGWPPCLPSWAQRPPPPRCRST